MNLIDALKTVCVFMNRFIPNSVFNTRDKDLRWLGNVSYKSEVSCIRHHILGTCSELFQIVPIFEVIKQWCNQNIILLQPHRIYYFLLNKTIHVQINLQILTPINITMKKFEVKIVDWIPAPNLKLWDNKPTKAQMHKT